jgi:hypothetical protein
MDLDNLAKYLVILHVLQCDTVLQSHAASNLEETRRIASGACYPVCGPNALPSRKKGEVPVVRTNKKGQDKINVGTA